VVRHQFFPRLALTVAAIAIAWTALSAGALAAAVVAITGVCTVAVGIALAAVAAIRRGLTGLAANGSGMCSGFSSEDAPGTDRTGGSPPLCEWLSDLFDRLAGKAPGAAPLTFGELRAAKVDLAMITTNLTHGRPLPLAVRG
jgi:hypothetical protein